MSAPLRARTITGAMGPLPGQRARSSALPGRPAPRPAPRQQPLRLVDDARLRLAASQRRRRRIVVVAATFAGLAFVALAASHAYLVTNQVRIDELAQRVDEAQARHQELRLEVAVLDSPERIISVAIGELGMVPAETVINVPPALTPAPPALSSPGPMADQSQSGAPAAVANVPAASWGAVKRHLGSH